MNDGSDQDAGSRLSVSFAILKTPLLALLVLAALLATTEIAARQLSAAGRIAVPSVGGATRQLDLQLAGLAALDARERLDCIVIGSSVVAGGVDPAALGGSYEERTGAPPLRCYTFGIPVLMAEGAAALSRILVEDHAPRLLVYGFAPRAFRLTSRDTRKDPSLAVPWVQHRLGHRTLEGWLVEHSIGYREFLVYRRWLDEGSWMVMQAEDHKEYSAGFLPENRTLRIPDRPGETGRKEAETGKDASAWQPDLGPLEALAELRGQGVVLVLLEMPLNPRMLRAVESGESQQRAVRAAVAAFADARGIPFLRPGPDVVPEDGWADLAHLNGAGAGALSAWLGSQLARRRLLPRRPSPA